MRRKESCPRTSGVKTQTVRSFSEAREILKQRELPRVIEGLDFEGSWAREAREARQRRELKQSI